MFALDALLLTPVHKHFFLYLFFPDVSFVFLLVLELSKIIHRKLFFLKYLFHDSNRVNDPPRLFYITDFVAIILLGLVCFFFWKGSLSNTYSLTSSLIIIFKLINHFRL